MMVITNYIYGVGSYGLYSLYLFPGMESLGDVAYSRHIGLLGNPNHTALFYAISFLIIYGSRDLIGLNKFLVYFVLLSLIAFLYLTLSRTVILSFILVFFMYNTSLKNSLVISVFFSFFVLFADIPSLVERFSSLSSFIARLSNWDVILEEYNLKMLFSGIPITKLNMAFDSEYLLVFVRHGIFVLIALLMLHFTFIYQAIVHRVFCVAMLHSLLLLCAVSMATFSDPRILFISLLYTLGKLNYATNTAKSE
ncbi:hypothetical protein [Vibrio sp. 10N.261.55.A7]|uniref:hypothetical protein n=1 Tax=Vibrio sp. 10N.261.55.A7 TaxID=1880851 RepID=UPI001056988B|nr:hypothetical protein [Vibrio sp. 10N.261.55.A7]